MLPLKRYYCGIFMALPLTLTHILLHTCINTHTWLVNTYVCQYLYMCVCVRIRSAVGYILFTVTHSWELKHTKDAWSIKMHIPPVSQYHLFRHSVIRPYQLNCFWTIATMATKTKTTTTKATALVIATIEVQNQLKKS